MRGHSRVGKKKSKVDIVSVLIITFFVGGLLIGMLSGNTLEATEKSNLANYLMENVNQLNSVSIFKTEYFVQNFSSQIKVIILIWISGFFAYGVFATYGLVAFKGFMYGFTVSFLTDQFGFNGFLFGFLSYVPHNLIYLPVLYILGKYSIRNSHLMSKQGGLNQAPKNMVVEYILLLFLVTAALAIGALIETYITPRLIGGLIIKLS